MRIIDYTNKFKKDYKREKKGQYRKVLDERLKIVVDMLVADTPLPQSFNDHALTGEWKDFRDCHVQPDLVLIYRKVGLEGLELTRIGSHSELGI